MSETPKYFVRELMRSGLREEDIHAELRKAKVRVSLSTINRIKNGKIKRTGSDIGLALFRLHERRKSAAAPEAQASVAA